MKTSEFRDVPTAGMGFILAYTVFRALKHKLKDFHWSHIAKVQVLSLKKERKKFTNYLSLHLSQWQLEVKYDTM